MSTQNNLSTDNLKIRPLHDRIVVKPQPTETKTSGGIVIPDTASQEKPQIGDVVATGKGKTNAEGKTQPLQISIGDKVLYGKYAGTAFKLGEKEYLVLKEEDVMGVLE